MIDAVDDGLLDAGAARRRNDDFLRAAVDVLAGRFGGAEQARALEHHVHPEVAPRQLGRITLREHLDPVAVDDDVAAVDVDLAVELAVCRVVARQVRVGLGVAQVVEGDDVELARAAILVDGTHYVAPDAAVAVDADLNCHVLLSVYQYQNFVNSKFPWRPRRYYLP